MSKELEELLADAAKTIGSLKRSMMAHPDCEEGSEFDDYTSTAQEMEDKIETYLRTAAATPATGQGMKWVKASERIPIDGVYFSRYDEEDSLFTVLNNGKPYKISFASGQTYRGGLIDLNKLVWLDQSPQPDKELEQLRQWKKEAMAVMPDFQELAKLMGVPLGESVHDKIIPYIKKLQNGKNLNQNT
jgi:hypothetical protein